MSNGKPDFSNVTGGVQSTEADAPAKPDFSNVSGGVQSVFLTPTDYSTLK